MISRTATVAAEQGLHARPAALFARAAGQSGYDVTIHYKDDSADASSLLELMTLGVEQGDEVELRCEDDSAADALDKLVELLQTPAE
ncbi:HPr family phosphocarrier protein [Trueperella sp. LYQ141]